MLISLNLSKMSDKKLSIQKRAFIVERYFVNSTQPNPSKATQNDCINKYGGREYTSIGDYQNYQQISGNW